MDMKFYICQGLDSRDSYYYALTNGTSKIKIDTKTDYYTGKYMESGDVYRFPISELQTMTFEGVYKKEASLNEFFLLHYFHFSEVDKVSLICVYDNGGAVFYNEGHLEILELESTPREMKIKGKIYFEEEWSDEDISDFSLIDE